MHSFDYLCLFSPGLPSRISEWESVIHCSLEQLQKYLGVTEHVKIARDHPPHGHSFWQWVLFMDELWLIKPGPKLTEIKGNSSFGFTGLGLAV